MKTPKFTDLEADFLDAALEQFAKEWQQGIKEKQEEAKAKGKNYVLGANFPYVVLHDIRLKIGVPKKAPGENMFFRTKTETTDEEE